MLYYMVVCEVDPTLKIYLVFTRLVLFSFKKCYKFTKCFQQMLHFGSEVYNDYFVSSQVPITSVSNLQTYYRLHISETIWRDIGGIRLGNIIRRLRNNI